VLERRTSVVDLFIWMVPAKEENEVDRDCTRSRRGRFSVRHLTEASAGHDNNHGHDTYRAKVAYGLSNAIIPSDAEIRYAKRLQDAFGRKGCASKKVWLEAVVRIWPSRRIESLSRELKAAQKAAATGLCHCWLSNTGSSGLCQRIAETSLCLRYCSAQMRRRHCSLSVFLRESPDAAAGFLDEQGLLRFVGPGLEN